MRESGLALAEIGWRFRLSRQRVAQIIDQAGRIPVDEVREARRGSQIAVARARAGEILESFRAGIPAPEIARGTGISVRAVRQTITERATDADRTAREQARLIAPRPPAYSDRQLLAGLRKVARRLGHPPSGSEYARVASELGLAAMPTVYMRFGGWYRALDRAGLESPTPSARVYTRAWPIAACWRALVSVTDQLGDPPRYRRYQELAAAREDLPSPSTLRVRLGLWSGIAAALAERNGAGGQRDGERRAARRNAAPGRANRVRRVAIAPPPNTGTRRAACASPHGARAQEN